MLRSLKCGEELVKEDADQHEVEKTDFFVRKLTKSNLRPKTAATFDADPSMRPSTGFKSFVTQ